MPGTAIVTMQRDESFFLPRWLDYYGGLFGRDHLYVVDNDSGPDCTALLEGVSRIRYPARPFDDQERARFVSGLASTLLELYDTVVVTDCDEFVAADPRTGHDLPGWLASHDFEHVTCIGLNVLARLDEESGLLAAGPVLAQRRHVRFVSPMCKVAVIRKPIRWGGGFHHANRPPHFAGLLLFHLKYADLGESLRRQASSRSRDWAHLLQGDHQRRSDLDLLRQFAAFARLPVADWCDDAIGAATAEFEARVTASVRGGDVGTMYVSPLDLASASLFRLPEAFAGLV